MTEPRHCNKSEKYQQGMVAFNKHNSATPEQWEGAQQVYKQQKSSKGSCVFGSYVNRTIGSKTNTNCSIKTCFALFSFLS
jgi:hypothetical protein